MRPGGLAAQPLGVVSRRDEQERCCVGADPVEGEEAGGMRCYEGDDELAGAFELGAGELSAPSELAQRDAVA